MSFIDTFAPTHLRLTEESPTWWRVTFDNPPVNVIGPDMMRDLKDLLTELESALGRARPILNRLRDAV